MANPPMRRPDGVTRNPTKPSGPARPYPARRDTNVDTPLSVDTLNSLSLLGKTLANTDIKKLKKLTDDELVTRKAQERLQQKTLDSLNEIITTLANNTGNKKEDVINQLGKKKGPLYDALVADTNSKERLEELLSSLGDKNELGENTVVKKLSDMQTQSEKHLEYRKQVTKDERENLKEFWSERLEKLGKAFEKHEDQVKNSLLGPLNLLVAPIEQFVGGSLFEGIKGFFQKRKEKKAKRNPGENDLVKHDDVAMLFLWHNIKHFFKGGKDEEGKNKGILGDLFAGLTGGAGITGLISKLGPTLLKALPIAALIGGILWSVIDGLAGIKMASIWGTSKFSAFLGGFLGGKESGWKGAFKNAGKGALIGFGIGMLAFGPLGGLIGAALGGLIWGLLGFIGGEKIAKGVDAIGKWFTNVWNSGIVQGIVNFVTSVFGNVIDFYKDQFKNVKDLVTGKKDILQFLIDDIGNIFKLINNVTTNFLDKTVVGQLLQKYVLNPITNFFNYIGDFFSYLSTINVIDFLKGKVDIGKGFETFHTGNIETRQQDFRKQMVLNQTKGDKGFAEKYAYAQSSGGKELDSLINTTYKGLEDKGLIIKGIDTSVQDAIIRPDGKVIRTDVNDTIVATKNTPSLNPGNSGLVEAKLDMMISLLQQLLNKDLIVNLPPQTTRDLDVLIEGLY